MSKTSIATSRSSRSKMIASVPLDTARTRDNIYFGPRKIQRTTFVGRITHAAVAAPSA